MLLHVLTTFLIPLENNTKYLNDDYIKRNVAITHVYFKHLHFMRQERGELYGFVELFSNSGGLIGLCMGFSALSLVEFVYFFTMRLFFNIKMSRNEKV